MSVKAALICGQKIDGVPSAFSERRGLIVREERGKRPACAVRDEKEAFDELSVKVHQSTHIFKPPNGSGLPSDSFFSTLLVI